MIRWGLSATIKAPDTDILDFAAHHLELGAHRLYLYLDAPAPAAYRRLKAHPKVRVTQCDDGYWQRSGKKRPVKHQVRQTHNASHAYNRRAEVDWLIHMDADEFLLPRTSVADPLGALPPEVLCARVRPAEALAGDGTLYKRFIPPGPRRDAQVAALYPRFGSHVKGGFMSHLAGKLFVRAGLPDMVVRIHNVFRGEVMNPGEVELGEITLLHRHAKNWDDWLAAFRYRHTHGAYRADLAPARAREKGGVTLHELLAEIEAHEGETGLRAFYDELCAATPEQRARLEAAGQVFSHDLELSAKRGKQFPNR